MREEISQTQHTHHGLHNRLIGPLGAVELVEQRDAVAGLHFGNLVLDVGEVRSPCRLLALGNAVCDLGAVVAQNELAPLLVRVTRGV